MKGYGETLGTMRSESFFVQAGPTAIGSVSSFLFRGTGRHLEAEKPPRNFGSIVLPYPQGMLIAQFVKNIPGELIACHEVLPINYDAGSGILTMVVTDPKNEKNLVEVKRLIKCSTIRLLVTPEAVFAKLVADLELDAEIDGPHQMVKLPDLFDQAENILVEQENSQLKTVPEKNLPKVLMISNEAFLKNFLGAIFEREGLHLVAPLDGNEIRSHLT
jgi:hypothetical protein